ncbi:MAG: GAF domain-containing sensor histidine kinase [Chloroflexi bacterium]|nr:GAF domain-containing sensor histidine kinase [Chloroflexota bacterium]
MGKINLSTLLPIPVLDDIIPAFERSAGTIFTVVIADTDGQVYYGLLPPEQPHCAFAPIILNHEEIGRVGVYAAHANVPVIPAAEFLARVLSQLALETWRRQQLTDELLERYDELNLIYDLGTSFVQGVSQEVLFKTVLDETNRILRADAGVIYSWDAAKSNITPVSFFGHQFAVGAWNSRVHELALNTLSAYEEAQLFDSERVLCAPLRYNDILLGALVLVYEGDGKTFKANDMNLLTALAHNTALFIYAVRLMDELKQTRDQLSRAERLSIIGQTVGSLVHDMRKPLSNAMGYAGLLQEENITFEERYQFAGQIIKYVRVFSDMAQEILDYISGDEKLRKAPVRVDDIMDQVSDLLMPPGLEQPVKIIMNYDRARGLFINVDRQRFVRVFQNLVNNSIDAIEISGGSKVEISADREDHYVRFSVTDDGPGVPPQSVHKIFEPGFSEGKPRGTGLGLAIVSRMVTVHGGEIRYESAPGQGARFVFRVPLNSNGTV